MTLDIFSTGTALFKLVNNFLLLAEFLKIGSKPAVFKPRANLSDKPDTYGSFTILLVSKQFFLILLQGNGEKNAYYQKMLLVIVLRKIVLIRVK